MLSDIISSAQKSSSCQKSSLSVYIIDDIVVVGMWYNTGLKRPV